MSEVEHVKRTKFVNTSLNVISEINFKKTCGVLIHNEGFVGVLLL